LVSAQGGNFPLLTEEMSAFKAAFTTVMRKEGLGFKWAFEGCT